MPVYSPLLTRILNHSADSPLPLCCSTSSSSMQSVAISATLFPLHGTYFRYVRLGRHGYKTVGVFATWDFWLLQLCRTYYFSWSPLLRGTFVASVGPLHYVEPLSLQLVASAIGSLSLQLVASATWDLCRLSWLLPPLRRVKILNRLRQNTIPCVSETLRPPTGQHYTSTSEDLAAYAKGSDPTS